jgi:hypothetical protein
VAAGEASSGACGACDFGLSVEASVDPSHTNCPEGLWEPESNFATTYALVANDDGTSTWYYADSGTVFATGYQDANSANFITDKACKWF